MKRSSIIKKRIKKLIKSISNPKLREEVEKAFIKKEGK